MTSPNNRLFPYFFVSRETFFQKNIFLFSQIYRKFIRKTEISLVFVYTFKDFLKEEPDV